MHSPRTVHPISTVNCHDKISLDKCQRKCLTNVKCVTFLDKMWKMKATVQCSVRWETGPGCRLPCRCCPRCRLPCTCCHAAIARAGAPSLPLPKQELPTLCGSRSRCAARESTGHNRSTVRRRAFPTPFDSYLGRRQVAHVSQPLPPGLEERSILQRDKCQMASKMVQSRPILPQLGLKMAQKGVKKRPKTVQ